MLVGSFRATLLFLLLIWLLAVITPCIAQLESSEVQAAEKLTASNLLGRLRSSVRGVPKSLKLGNDNFLGLGAKRKSIAGVYGTTAAVGVGGAAIAYQTMNLRSKDRDARNKMQSEYKIRRRRKGWVVGCQHAQNALDTKAFAPFLQCLCICRGCASQRSHLSGITTTITAAPDRVIVNTFDSGAVEHVVFLPTVSLPPSLPISRRTRVRTFTTHSSVEQKSIERRNAKHDRGLQQIYRWNRGRRFHFDRHHCCVSCPPSRPGSFTMVIALR